MFYSINTNPFIFEPQTQSDVDFYTRILYADAHGCVNDETFSEPQGDKAPYSQIIILANPRCENVRVQNMGENHLVKFGIIGAKNVFMDNCIASRMATDATGIVSIRDSEIREVNAPNNVTTSLANMSNIAMSVYTPNITELNIRNADIYEIMAPKLESLNILDQSSMIAKDTLAHAYEDIIISPDMPYGVIGFNMNTMNVVTRDGALPIDSFLHEIRRPKNYESQKVAQDFLHEAKHLASQRTSNKKAGIETPAL